MKHQKQNKKILLLFEAVVYADGKRQFGATLSGDKNELITSLWAVNAESGFLALLLFCSRKQFWLQYLKYFPLKTNPTEEHLLY